MSNTCSVYVTQAGNDPTLEGVAASSTNTYYSRIWGGLGNQDGYGLHVVTDGTLTGTWTLWMSDKRDPVLTSDADWVQDTGFSPTNPAGAASKFRDDTSTAKARWKRLKYVNASGTGNIFAYVTVPRMA